MREAQAALDADRGIAQRDRTELWPRSWRPTARMPHEFDAGRFLAELGRDASLPVLRRARAGACHRSLVADASAPSATASCAATGSRRRATR